MSLSALAPKCGVCGGPIADGDGVRDGWQGARVHLLCQVNRSGVYVATPDVYRAAPRAHRVVVQPARLWCRACQQRRRVAWDAFGNGECVVCGAVLVAASNGWWKYPYEPDARRVLAAVLRYVE